MKASYPGRRLSFIKERATSLLIVVSTLTIDHSELENILTVIYFIEYYYF